MSHENKVKEIWAGLECPSILGQVKKELNVHASIRVEKHQCIKPHTVWKQENLGQHKRQVLNFRESLMFRWCNSFLWADLCGEERQLCLPFISSLCEMLGVLAATSWCLMQLHSPSPSTTMQHSLRFLIYLLNSAQLHMFYKRKRFPVFVQNYGILIPCFN